MRALRIAAAAALTLGATGVGAQTPIYFNDFETDVAGITGSVSRIQYPAGCTSVLVCPAAGAPNFYLGAGDGNPFRLGQTFSINLAGLPTHTGLRLSFDYFPLHSMDGSSFGPDGLLVTGDGNTIFNALFANWPGATQTHCPPTGSGPGNACGRWTGAAEVNTLGYTFQGDVGSSLYQLSIDFAHTSSTSSILFTALTNQDWADEGMGFDNVRVQALGVPTPGVVPEPSTYALMATGLLALGGIARRRRQG